MKMRQKEDELIPKENKLIKREEAKGDGLMMMGKVNESKNGKESQMRVRR